MSIPRFDPVIPEQAEPSPAMAVPRRSVALGWLASGVTHLTALGLMAGIYTIVRQEPEEQPPTKFSVILPPPPRVVVNDHPQDSKPTDFIPLPDPSDKPTPVSDLDLPPSDLPDGDIEAPADEPPAVRGNPDFISDHDLGSTGLASVIGIGDGDSGKPGGPISGRGKPGGHKPHGTPMDNIKAVDRALRWFKRHQSPDGHWDAVNYWSNCTEDGAKCEPGRDAEGDTNVALTAYALLCFLGDGYDHQTPSAYRSVVRNGLEWLLKQQKPEGLLGQRNYEHAIATMALAQAYAMSPDPALRDPAQHAVDVILARQNRDAQTRLGWDYVTPSGRNDASVTGWNVMALKSGYIANLKIGDGLDGCKAWLNRSWTAANTNQPWCDDPTKLNPYTGISRFPYVWNTGGGKLEIADWDAAAKRPTSTDSHDLAPVGLLCAVFLGHQPGEAMVDTMANYIVQNHQPQAYPSNLYYLYYNSLALFQLGGERFKQWDATVSPMLANAQRNDGGCLDGSWDWQDTKYHGSDTGRVLSTAYACLSMQVYWLYDRQIKAAKGK